MSLSIVSVSAEGQLAVAQDRKVLPIEYDENTLITLKQYIETMYEHNFNKQPHYRIFTSTIYSIANNIKESFYFHETHSVFSEIDIQGDYFISLAKVFNLINDIRKYMLNSVLENIYFYVEE